MAEELSPQTTVSYTVREVLDEQTKLLRGIDQKVDGKADKADLVEAVNGLRSDLTGIRNQVSGHGERILSLENWRISNARLLSAGGVLLLAVAGVLGSLISAHVI